MKSLASLFRGRCPEGAEGVAPERTALPQSRLAPCQLPQRGSQVTDAEQNETKMSLRLLRNGISIFRRGIGKNRTKCGKHTKAWRGAGNSLRKLTHFSHICPGNLVDVGEIVLFISNNLCKINKSCGRILEDTFIENGTSPCYNVSGSPIRKPLIRRISIRR